MKKPFKNPFRHHRAKNRNKPRGYSPTQIICVSFVIVIALGTLLLSLPIASRYGRMRVIDAMFTATSATCVTGLVVRDTWTQFTAFGQAVILVLIQVGGLGLVTLTSFFALAMRRRMGFRDLRVLGESGHRHPAAAVRLCAAVWAPGHLDQHLYCHFGFLQRRL